MKTSKMSLKLFKHILIPLNFICLLVFVSCNHETSQSSSEEGDEEQNFSYSDKVHALTGFRKYELGTDRSLYPELIKTNNSAQVRSENDYIYVNTEENLKIGEITIEQVEYSFMKNKLREVSFLVPNKGVSKLLQAYLDRYGRGKTSSEFGGTDILWENGDYTLKLLPYKFGADYHRVLYQSKSLNEEYRSSNFGVPEGSVQKIIDRKKAMQNDL